MSNIKTHMPVKLISLDHSDKEDGLELNEVGLVIDHPYDKSDADGTTVYVNFSGVRKWMNVSQLEVIKHD